MVYRLSEWWGTGWQANGERAGESGT